MDRKGIIYGSCADEDAIRSGKGRCDIRPGLTKYLLLADKRARFPLDPAEFNAAIKSYIYTNAITRLIPIGEIDGGTPSGGTLETQSSEYGDNTTTGVAAITVPYHLKGASLCQRKELSKLNRRDFQIFHVDANGNIFGWAISEGGAESFVGYTGTTFVYDEMAQNNTTPWGLRVNVDYSGNFYHEQDHAHGFALDNAVPNGLIGVTLQQTTTAGQMKIVSACGGEDAGIQFAGEWAPEAFIDESGANPTSAAMNPDTGILTIAPTSAKYRIADAEVLNGLDIVGLDGVQTLVSAAAKA